MAGLKNPFGRASFKGFSRGAPPFQEHTAKDRRMTIDNVIEQVARCYDAALAAYRSAQKRGGAGQAPAAGGQLDGGASNAVYTQRDNAMNAIRAALASREAELTEAPSAEAVNYLAAIAGRENMSADEIGAALDRYGNTHAAQKAILCAAQRSGVSLTDTRTETERDIAALRELAAKVEREFSPLKFGNMSEGKRWLIKSGKQWEL